MKNFEYADEDISEKEIMIAVPSMVIRVTVLFLPKNVAQVTLTSDGWVALLFVGIIAILLSWVVARLAASFPNQTFLDYASAIATKPVAMVLTFLFSIMWLNLTAYEVRKIADISKQYLFDQTPVEVISLMFLFIIVYAVSGSRAGIFRLNMMFLPFIIFITITVLVFNIGFFDMRNFLPMFKTDFNGYVEAIGTSIPSYFGFVIVLFYISLVKKPKRTPKKTAIGMCIPLVLFLILFVMCIGVFGNSVTSNLLYPVIELAKIVDIPGGFFERFESLFFVIWIMAIFNTTAMSFDLTVLTLNYIFKKTPKVKIVIILAPIIYAISMFPQNIMAVSTFGTMAGYLMTIYSIFVTLVLIAIAKIRGVKRVE